MAAARIGFPDVESEAGDPESEDRAEAVNVTQTDDDRRPRVETARDRRPELSRDSIGPALQVNDEIEVARSWDTPRRPRGTAKAAPDPGRRLEVKRTPLGRVPVHPKSHDGRAADKPRASQDALTRRGIKSCAHSRNVGSIGRMAFEL